MRIERFDVAAQQGRAFDHMLRTDAASRPMARLPHAPDLDGILAAADSVLRQRRPLPALIRQLEQYNLDMQHSAGAVAAQRLRHPRALVVITGQQPALFGGPLLSLHKCFGAVLLAQALERVHGAPVVPVFWVHSVDHDLAEANRILVPSDGDWRQATADIVDTGRSLSHVLLNERACTDLVQLSAGLGLSTESALQPRVAESLTEWSTRCLLEQLPSGLGIVLADAQQLMPFGANLWQRCISERDALGAAVNAGTAAVRAVGQEPQVLPRDSLQLFCENNTGQRGRLLAHPSLRMETRDGAQPITETELMAIAQTQPERFSPGVLLRPVLQQTLLPVCAHVNGPAENAYFAQLPELFEALHQALPVAFPRPSLSWMPKRAERWVKQAGISPQTLLAPMQEWPQVSEAIPANVQDIQTVAERLVHVARDAGRAHGSEEPTEAFAAHVNKAVQRLCSALERRRGEASGSVRQARHRLGMLLHPHGHAQERMLSVWAVLGPNVRGLVAEAFAEFNLFDFRHALVRVHPEDEA